MKHTIILAIITIAINVSNYNVSALIDNEDQSNGKLVYYTLDPPVPCGDGSPAGFYTDAYTSNDSSSISDNPNHIINFMFGGGCATPAACAATRTVQPYLTSSNFEPDAITGSTILSNDANENPTMADYVKWNVPYCSQDLWLGSGGMNGDLIRGGSTHVLAVLDHWLEGVLGAGVEVDTLVISGVSAGTMAIINHFDHIKQVAAAAKVKSLRLILDSSLYPDRIDTNFTPLLQDAVDPEVHPLCFKDAAEELQHDYLSNLPCCLSTHCMLRHDKTLSTWARSSENNDADGDDTQMLLIDASYDSLQGFLDLSSTDSPMNALPKNGGVQSLDGIASTTFSIGEYAGARKSRVVETMYGGERQLGPKVIWAVTSAPGHTALIPAVELSTRLCESGKLMMESMCMGESDCIFSEYPGGITQECNSTGFGLKIPLGDGLRMTMWTTVESWNLLTINGESIHQIISDFVSPTSDAINSDTSSAIILMDSCPGPNCVPAGSTMGNSAQSLIEIEDVITPIGDWLRILVSIIIASIPFIYAMTVTLMKWKMMKAKNTDLVPGKMANANGSDVFLEGLSVFSDTGDQILDKVSIHLRQSSLTCLLGKSGSGKSCMLGVLSRQLRSNLNVQYINGTDLSKVACTLMRQNDMGMDNMTPNDYLRSTAKVYGTEEARLNFILSLAQPFFPVRMDELGNIVFDPFNHAPINQLSGGQRRMISIATALFQPSSLLLLDEPLSGIDSASSDKITDLLKKIAKENFVTILMTLHQPSDDILSKMDKVMVLDGGRILLDRDFDVESVQHQQSAKSAAEAIHGIISRGSVTGIGDSTLRIFKSDLVEDSKENDNESNDNDSEEQIKQSKYGQIRIWQVLPLLERLHLECPPSKQDFLVLPFCYLAISLWGSFDAANPLQAFLVTAALTFIPSILFQYRLIINWGILTCHTWDLEDKRISPLSYLISTFIQLVYLPILVIIASLSIAYGIFGWPFTGFWDVCLFSIMVTITELQFGKMLCAVMSKFQSVASLYAVYTYLGAVVSGFFVNPARIPSYFRWVMYSSLAFWGISGAELTQVAQYSVDEEQCLTAISCLILNRNSIAQYMGFTTVTTAHVSMLALLIALLLLLLIEYFFLLRKVRQRGNFERVNQVGQTKMVESLNEIEEEVDQI